ncbi:hypothetical protein [Fodinicola acaciae]|uniref:hypothetical protein n=1 Tax=Fodinicola acaciae TaxID=2681555 RepID=UPI0013D76737|nr:hypothetical protein [Fodinicola acaciae]
MSVLGTSADPMRDVFNRGRVLGRMEGRFEGRSQGVVELLTALVLLRFHEETDIEASARRIAYRFRDADPGHVARSFLAAGSSENLADDPFEKAAGTRRRPTLLEQTYDDGNFDGWVEASEDLLEALLQSRFGDDAQIPRAARRLACLTPANAVAAVESSSNVGELLAIPIPEPPPEAVSGVERLMSERRKVMIVEELTERFGAQAVLARIDDIGLITHRLARLDSRSALDVIAKATDLDVILSALPGRNVATEGEGADIVEWIRRTTKTQKT